MSKDISKKNQYYFFLNLLVLNQVDKVSIDINGYSQILKKNWISVKIGYP